jgi:hypothetical protein
LTLIDILFAIDTLILITPLLYWYAIIAITLPLFSHYYWYWH